jgi:5'-nucleotidase
MRQKNMNKNKKRIFIDMDGVLADFDKAVRELEPEIFYKYIHRHDEIPKFFRTFDTIPFSESAVRTLNRFFDLFILSTPS